MCGDFVFFSFDSVLPFSVGDAAMSLHVPSLPVLVDELLHTADVVVLQVEVGVIDELLVEKPLHDIPPAEVTVVVPV